MFSKTPKTGSSSALSIGSELQTPRPTPTPGAAAPIAAGGPARQGPRPVVSVLCADLVFEGAVSGEGDLQLDGVVKGDIQVSRLVVGESARVEGHIRCAQVDVRGHVIGDIEAQAVRLYETAHVEGDIAHAQLAIDAGAFFQGRCQQLRAAVAPTPLHEPVSAQVIPLEAAS